MAQITVAEFAEILSTDARTARKFLRSITPKDSCPGKGARWAIEKREVRSLTKKFAAFSAAEIERKNARDAAKNAPAESIENDDAEILDDAEPTDDELAEIRDIENDLSI